MRRYLATISLMLASPAWAMDPTASALLEPCPEPLEIAQISIPWDQNTASFSDGTVNFVIVNGKGGGQHIAVLYLPFQGDGSPECRIYPGGGDGYDSIVFDRSDDGLPRYDPQQGLTVAFNVTFAVNDEQFDNWLFVNLNQQTGEVRAQGFQ